MVIAPEIPWLTQAAPWRAGGVVPTARFDDIHRAMVIDHCKWAPRVQDVSTLAPFPLILADHAWRYLSLAAENLTAELINAEQALLGRPELFAKLGLGRSLRRCLGRAAKVGLAPPAGRILRFDFHWTDAGWRISEVNSDVPGGFTESSSFPALMAPFFPGCRPAGNPADAWIDAIVAAAKAPMVVLLAASGFMEDQQVVAYLAQQLTIRGLLPRLASPRQIQWTDGVARVDGNTIGAIVRFYQAEWLNPRRAPELLVGWQTPVLNPGYSALTESKRFPLVWDRLGVAMPTWRRLLPETRRPADAPWRTDDSWLVKSAFCNTGDSVAIRAMLSDREWNSVKRSVWLAPNDWIAQRRFTEPALQSPAGPIYPCVGVYTVNGKTAGAYGRFNVEPLINYAAVDVAILVEHTYEQT